MKEPEAIASSDIVAVAKWLHSHDLVGNFSAIDLDTAALEGHLDIVRFLHEHSPAGCTTDAMDNAAQRGHLEIVRFLHENRNEGSSPRVLLSAVFAGNLEMMRWLFDHHPSKFTLPIVLEAIQKARQFYHLDIALWLE